MHRLNDTVQDLCQPCQCALFSVRSLHSQDTSKRLGHKPRISKYLVYIFIIHSSGKKRQSGLEFLYHYHDVQRVLLHCKTNIPKILRNLYLLDCYCYSQTRDLLKKGKSLKNSYTQDTSKCVIYSKASLFR
jgi:hypothetical protein